VLRQGAEQLRRQTIQAGCLSCLKIDSGLAAQRGVDDILFRSLSA
jgi:hypothetical protein